MKHCSNSAGIDELIHAYASENRRFLTVYQHIPFIGKTSRIAVSVDTGMTRIGMQPVSDSMELVRQIAVLENIEIEGIFTHFANSRF